MNEKKIRMTVRITPQMKEKLAAQKVLTGKSETAIIEEALEGYFSDDHEDLVRLFLERFDEKYKNLFTRLRLSATTADRNIEALLNLKNSELFYEGARPDHFTSMYQTEHGLITQAREAVKEQIALYKQRKDNAKVD